MKEIYLIRHAKPLTGSQLNYIDNMTEQEKNEKIPLSSDGEKKASDLANTLFKEEISHVFSSTYERTISTAKYIAELNGLPIIINSLFNERKLGNTEGIDDNFWLEQLYDGKVKTKNGESRYEVCARMLKGLNVVLETTPEDGKSVIVSHATAMTFLLMNWCLLIEANLIGKKRWLKYNNKDIINDSFRTPEIFKLSFANNELVNIERINFNN